ncbi:hypothetical protein [Sphingomonas rosea]
MARAADPSATTAVAPMPVPGVLRAGTTIDVEFSQAASSRTSKSGDLVALKTVGDVRGVQNELLIPAGSPVVAEVIQASPARMMGKAGELTLAARYVEVGGTRITLKRFRFGTGNGKDNTGTTMAATALIGLPGMLISGGNVDVAVGARANAVVVSDTPLGAPAPALAPAPASAATVSTTTETNQPTGGL